MTPSTLWIVKYTSRALAHLSSNEAGSSAGNPLRHYRCPIAAEEKTPAVADAFATKFSVHQTYKPHPSLDHSKRIENLPLRGAGGGEVTAPPEADPVNLSNFTFEVGGKKAKCHGRWKNRQIHLSEFLRVLEPASPVPPVPERFPSQTPAFALSRARAISSSETEGVSTGLCADSGSPPEVVAKPGLTPRDRRMRLSKLQVHSGCGRQRSGCGRGHTRCGRQANEPRTRTISTFDTVAETLAATAAQRAARAFFTPSSGLGIWETSWAISMAERYSVRAFCRGWCRRANELRYWP
ncbi:hypothetical protein DB88DRAFT_546513 [Papiliotrema laurentii]|uniref:Uncharacterized protein n=1 Tax=Papiliotrema laurentii TaxID=5418 RepID=A0AAD9D1W2_PAPLA|nr:hypothetical protein DB88DRAFT_546513 [Papiliotrema laurentii]